MGMAFLFQILGTPRAHCSRVCPPPPHFWNPGYAPVVCLQNSVKVFVLINTGIAYFVDAPWGNLQWRTWQSLQTKAHPVWTQLHCLEILWLQRKFFSCETPVGISKQDLRDCFLWDSYTGRHPFTHEQSPSKYDESGQLISISNGAKFMYCTFRVWASWHIDGITVVPSIRDGYVGVALHHIVTVQS